MRSRLSTTTASGAASPPVRRRARRAARHADGTRPPAPAGAAAVCAPTTGAAGRAGRAATTVTQIETSVRRPRREPALCVIEQGGFERRRARSGITLRMQLPQCLAPQRRIVRLGRWRRLRELRKPEAESQDGCEAGGRGAGAGGGRLPYRAQLLQLPLRRGARRDGDGSFAVLAPPQQRGGRGGGDRHDGECTEPPRRVIGWRRRDDVGHFLQGLVARHNTASICSLTSRWVWMRCRLAPALRHTRATAARRSAMAAATVTYTHQTQPTIS